MSDIRIESGDYVEIASQEALTKHIKESTDEFSIRISLPRPINSDQGIKRMLGQAIEAQSPENIDLDTPNRQARINFTDVVASGAELSDDEVEKLGDNNYGVHMMPVYSSESSMMKFLGDWKDQGDIYALGSTGLGNQARRMAQKTFQIS